MLVHNLVVTGSLTFPTALPISGSLLVSGSVGINTNPTKALEILSNTSQDGIKISGANNPRLTIVDTTNNVQFDALTTDTEAVLRTDTNHPLHLSTNGTARVIISSAGTSSFSGTVGIGTTSPSGLLQVGVANSGIYFDVSTQYTPKIKAAGTISDLQIESVGSGGNMILGAPGATSVMQFFVNGTLGTGERMRITSDGYLRLASSGIQFNGDTAAANALNDYEEGSWTPTLGGTWSTNPTSMSGTYTKIGNMVFIRLLFTGGVKSSETAGYFNGLPFSGASGGGGTVSNVNVEDKGIALLDNSTRVWVTNLNFGGVITKAMASYQL
jgi:hypothetical protein